MMPTFDPFGSIGQHAELTGQNIPGVANVSEAELRKAILAGLPVHTPGSGNLDAIMPEDLSALVTELTFQDKHNVVGKLLAKAEASNMLHQFARLQNQGGLDADFVTEGGGTEVDADPEYDRPNVQLRQVTRSYRLTEAMRRVRVLSGSGANAAKAELQRQALIKAERNLDFARVLGRNAANPRSYNGIIPLLEAAETTAGLTDTYIIDMRGEELTPEKLDEQVVAIFNRAGSPENLLTSADIIGRLAQRQLASRRDTLPIAAKPGPVHQGMMVNGFLSSTGYSVEYTPTVVMQPEYHTLGFNAAGVGPNRPDQPVIASIGAGAPGGGQVSKWVAADNGNYTYRVAAYGIRGQSVSADSGAQAVTAGQMVSITITDAAVNLVDHYKVWRRRGTGPFQFMAQVPKAAFGTDTVIEDLNHDVPGTSWALMFNPAPDNVQKVLLGNKDFEEFPIAFGTDANFPTSWGYLLIKFEAIALRAPQWMVAFKNCASRNV